MVDPDAPYADLTPDAVLDALNAAGLYPDGRLMALNSYENRVFQIGLDDGQMVVAKFYRPGRWSDAQILEEHAFAQQLADADIPAVAPMALPDTLLHWSTPEGTPYRFSIMDSPESTLAVAQPAGSAEPEEPGSPKANHWPKILLRTLDWPRRSR